MTAMKGKDFTDDESYGGNIFLDNDTRPNEYGNTIGQRLKKLTFIFLMQTSAI